MEIYGKSYCYNAGCYSVPKTECASFFFLKKKGDISISQLQLKAYTIRQDKPQFKSMEKSWAIEAPFISSQRAMFLSKENSH